ICSTPAPPSTALVAASIWSGTGDVKTAPGQAASSMPSPTKPPCIGSWPLPPPEMMPTLPLICAPARTMKSGSSCTAIRPVCARAMPASASLASLSGELISFFTVKPPYLCLHRQRHRQHTGDDSADDRADDRDPGIAPIRVTFAGDRQHEVRDARAEIASRVDGVASRPAKAQTDTPDQHGN